VDRGYVYGRWEHVDAEIRNYRQAVALDPENAYAHYRLGLTLYLQNKMAGAKTHLERAQALAPSWEAIWIYLIKTYAETGEFEKVSATVEEALLHFAGADEALIRRFYREKLDACVHNNRYADGCALEKYVLNPEDEEDNADACRLLGDCFFEMGRDETAADLYERALDADEYSWDNWHRYAYFCRFGLKNTTRAMDAYRKAIKYRPDFWADYINLANLNLSLGRNVYARKLFNTARTMLEEELKTNRYPCAYYFLAECYFGLGDSESAEKYANRARALAKNYIVCVTRNCYEGSFLLAKIRQSQGRTAAARRYYMQTIAASQDREYRDARGKFIP
jgi:tetratricopeptide (TPR) repeat protein